LMAAATEWTRPLSVSWSLCLVVAFAVVQPSHGKRMPLDVAGSYDETMISGCHCWGHHCACAKDGCNYVGRFKMDSPDGGGFFNVSMGATDRKCLNSTFGPFQLHVDSAGFILGGVHVGVSPKDKITHFNPLRLEQDMTVMVIGNVFGFNHNPAGLRAIVLDRHNLTICQTKSFIDGSCTPGRPRYTCRDVFSYCSGGKCLDENLELLSPKADAYFAQYERCLSLPHSVRPDAAYSAFCAALPCARFFPRLRF